jgi:hypothetical protein
MRNGVAHGNIEFVADVSGHDIAEIKLWNTNGNCRKTWGTQVSTRDLAAFVNKLCETLLAIREDVE